MDSQADSKSLENELRQMILSNVRVEAQPSQHYSGRGRGHQGPHQSSQNGFGRQQHQGQRGRGDPTWNRPSQGRGYFRGQQRGNFHSNVPSDRQEGFNQFMAQHGTAPRQGQHFPGSDGRHGAQGYPQHRVPPAMDTASFRRGPPSGLHNHSSPYNQQLWNAQGPRPPPGMQQVKANDLRWQYLEEIADREIPQIEMPAQEKLEKEQFRAALQDVFVKVISQMQASDLPNMSLESFGSFRSGFATAGSDLDLVIVSQSYDSMQSHLSLDAHGLPRLLEQALLDQGYGARLLSRTRVPIIKICQQPSRELLEALRKARAEWDALPEDEKLGAKPAVKDEEHSAMPQKGPKEATEGDAAIQAAASSAELTQEAVKPATIDVADQQVPLGTTTNHTATTPQIKQPEQPADKLKMAEKSKADHTKKPWLREKARGPLDFPKDGVGIQSDINFFNPLGLHNTEMLRCYALCDVRVRRMILFVKAWAKKRRINHAYSGTLSSYGYVLMVLHYLANVARPPVVPNLQLEAESLNMPAVTVDGWEVRFWRDEEALERLVQNGQMSRNREPLGVLLKGFFQYFASTQSGHGFIWMQDVLSLRTRGGLLSKEQKGWTGAKTETTETKEVRHRYLFAIEDPFELSHNVGRTVTHNGIVAIRDEFRRAWRIMGAVGQGVEPRDGHLFDALVEQEGSGDDGTHGKAANGDAVGNGSQDREGALAGVPDAKPAH